MRWIYARKLKTLRHWPVPETALASGRARLVALMPVASGAKLGWFAVVAWRPVAAFAVIGFAVTSGGAVMASQGSMPGQALYPVKLAVERVQERLTLSSERKLTVQAQHAERRLVETQRIMARTGVDEDAQAVEVKKSIDRYEDRLFRMNELTVLLSSEPTKKGKQGKRAMAAVERVLDRHLDLVDSASASAPKIASAVMEPVVDTMELEEDVLAALPAILPKEDPAGGFEKRSEERDRRMDRKLKDFRDTLQSGLKNDILSPNYVGDGHVHDR